MRSHWLNCCRILFCCSGGILWKAGLFWKNLSRSDGGNCRILCIHGPGAAAPSCCRGVRFLPAALFAPAPGFGRLAEGGCPVGRPGYTGGRFGFPFGWFCCFGFCCCLNGGCSCRGGGGAGWFFCAAQGSNTTPHRATPRIHRTNWSRVLMARYVALTSSDSVDPSGSFGPLVAQAVASPSTDQNSKSHPDRRAPASLASSARPLLSDSQMAAFSTHSQSTPSPVTAATPQTPRAAMAQTTPTSPAWPAPPRPARARAHQKPPT